MSAAEIIEQIKAMPPEERQVVRDFLAREEPGASQPPRSVSFEEARRAVFAKHDRVLAELAK